MEIKIKEPLDIEQLKREIKNKTEKELQDFFIRIENNIFTVDGKWLLKNTDGTLENINTFIKEDDEHIPFKFRNDVRKATENFDEKEDIIIKKMLYSRIDKSEEKPCITLSFLSILDTGNLEDIKKWEDKGFNWKDINKINRDELSTDTSYTYDVICKEKSEIENLLSQFSKLSERKFEQYFMHGMENREKLQEGIMYYTGMDLTKKYLEIQEEEGIPSKDQMIQNLKKNLYRNFEQLYRFIYMLDGEDNRFNYDLRAEEKEKVTQMVEDTFQNLLEEKKLNFNRRGIFFEFKGEPWTGEVYKALRQLEFMERTDNYKYYSRWLQAKIGRLKASGKYSKEDLEQIEEIYTKYFDTKEKEKEKDTDKNKNKEEESR